jgi:hypothetical protein
MVLNQITQTDVARTVGVSPGLVNKTIHGLNNNRRVLRELVRLGCPEKFLALPEDMQRKEAR